MYQIIQEFYNITHKPKQGAALWYSEAYDEMEECLIEVMERLPHELTKATEVLLDIQKLYQDTSIEPKELMRRLEVYRYDFIRWIGDLMKWGW